MPVLALMIDWDWKKTGGSMLLTGKHLRTCRNTLFSVGLTKRCQPHGTHVLSLSLESSVLWRPSIFTTAHINHQGTLKSYCEMVEEPPTVIVFVSTIFFNCRLVYVMCHSDSSVKRTAADFTLH